MSAGGKVQSTEISMFPQTTDLATPMPSALCAMHSEAKSFLFDFSKGDFVLKDGKLQAVEDIDALRVWIEKILRTKRDEYKIYEGTAYGSRFDDLVIGSVFPTAFVDSELRREIEEALIQHPRIITISDFIIDRSASDCTVSFTVILTSGLSFGQEVALIV